MSNMNFRTVRALLGATVSALAISGAASAQTLTLTSGAHVVTLSSAADSDNLYAATTIDAAPAPNATYTTIEIPIGVNAFFTPTYGTGAIGSNTAIVIAQDAYIHGYSISSLNPCQNGSLAWDHSNSDGNGYTCLGRSPTIQVDQGGTLTIAAQQTGGWTQGYGFESAIHADGDVIIDYAGTAGWGPRQEFYGTNYFLGNIILADAPAVPDPANQCQGCTAQFGISWNSATTVFGPNTNIILGNNTRLDIWQSATTPLTMGGTLQGTGELRLAGGTLFINGINTAAVPFHGNFNIRPAATGVIGDVSHPNAVIGDPGNVSGYTLMLAGAISGAPNLRGFGTIAGNLVNNASVVRPGYGNDLGTLTVLGNYTQDAVGTLRVQVTPTGASSLHVVGNAAVNGTLNIAIAPGAYRTQIYDILTVDGTITGDFGTIVTDSVQGAIGAVTKTDHGYSVVTEVVQGASATAPIVVGHLADVNRLNSYYFVGALYDRIARDTPRNEAEIGRNKYVWIEGFGRVSSVSRDDIGYHTDTEGVRAGIEYRTESNATIGLAGSYSTGSLKAKGSSTADTDTWHVAAYGGYDLQYVRLDGVLFYDVFNTTAKRDFGADGVAVTSPDGYSYGGSIQASRSLMRDLLTPFVRGIFSRQHVDASVETGAPLLNLRYLANNHNTLVADLGFRINPLRALPDSRTKLLITVALEHDFSPLGERVDGTFPVTDGQSWFSYWRGDSENTALLGIDLARQVTDQLEISGRVNGRVSLFQTSGEVVLNARYRL